MVTKKFKLWSLFFVLCICSSSFAHAEIKTFVVKVREIVGRNQSQEQVEAFALQKAKRLAVEQAGTYISSLTIVRNYNLEKDEVTALASGVVQAKIVGVPSISVDNSVVHIEVNSKISVDTSILETQIQEIMKEKGTLKKLEEERRKVKELEERLANLKGMEQKRLEQLNAQALALERERERQQLFRQEEALKARGELSKVEAERLAREREMQERINKTLAEQEKAKRAEAEALAKEQDRIRRAQLENEQRWNELARKAQLSQASWKPIDDSLSLYQAIEEVKQIKNEIANLSQRMDFQLKENIKNLRRAFKKQREHTLPELPSEPAEKDLFETTEEYNKRITAHEAKIKVERDEIKLKVSQLEAEENYRIAQVERENIEQKTKIMEPFVERLRSIQRRKFLLPEEKVSVSIAPPVADNKLFPLELQYRNLKWKKYWHYRDRNRAKALWKTRTYLIAQGVFQLDQSETTIGVSLTGCKVSHPGTGDTRDFDLKTLNAFTEISDWKLLKRSLVAAQAKERHARFARETAGYLYKDGHVFKYYNGTVYDTKTRLKWYAGPDRDMTWKEGKEWVNNLSVDGGGWRMPAVKELRTLYQDGKGTRNMSSLFETTGWWVWADTRSTGEQKPNYSLELAVETWMSGRSRAFAVRPR